MGRILAVLLTAILLFGCGGGDKGVSPNTSGPSSNNLTYLNNDVLLFVSDISLYASTPQGRVRLLANSNCDPQGCSVSNSALGYSERFTIEDLVAEGESIPGSFELVDSGSRNGVELYRASQHIPYDDGDIDVEGFGGWMRHNTFVAFVGETTSQGVHVEAGLGLSIGIQSGSFPAVSATYNGVMLGIDRRPAQHGNPVRGDARIDFTLTQPNDPRVSISFSNIDGGSTSSMNWQSLSVGQNGTFYHGNISGSFYGANHQEVGGTFNAHDVVGAYGAAK